VLKVEVRGFPGDCTAPLDGAFLSRPKVQQGGSLAGKLSASVSSIISSGSFSSVPSLPIGLLHLFSSAGELIHFALRAYATYGIEPAIPALPCGITCVKPATETPIIK
jgi:hypothetical protein